MQPQRSFWAGKQVCVTGGSGFLGMHLVRQLKELQAEVRVLTLAPRLDHPFRSLQGIQTIFGDILDAALVHEALAGCEIVFHVAGLVAVWGPALRKMLDVHITGTRNVLAEAERSARIVHTSSIVAVGASRHGESWTEDRPYNLGSLRIAYVQAKHAAERLALTSDRDVIVTNPGYMIGPHDYDGSVMGRFCHRFWKGRIPFAPPGGFNLVDVRDVARGHLLAAEHGKPQRRYILGGENYATDEFMKLLASTAGWRPRALPRLPQWAVALLAHVAEARAQWTGKEPYPGVQHARLGAYFWFAESTRAQAELGYESRSVRASVADTWDWFRSQGVPRLTGPRDWWMRPSGSPQAA